MSELIAKDIWDRIPEEEKVCVNCDYFVGQTHGGTDKCHGTRPCCNYSDKWKYNFFVPDECYLSDKFGCDACDHYYGGEPTEECGSCRRYYDDNWAIRRER